MTTPAASGLTDALRRWYLHRELHPWAWWVWAIGLAVAASRTTNPLILGLLIGASGVVVMLKRGDSPWAGSYRLYLVLALVIVVMRVLFRIIFAGGQGQTVLLHLPLIPLPSWAAGITLLGDVTAEAMTSGLYDGLRLGTLILAIGAANSLANPRRMLRGLPASLHGLGTVLIVAVSVFPQLAESVLRVRRARALRGGASKGRGQVTAIVIPVLTDALDRSLLLAASLESRGYGRHGPTPLRIRRTAAALTTTGLLVVATGVYGMLDLSAPRPWANPALAVGVVMAAGGLVLTGRHVRITRYRPDRWDGAAIAVALSGVLTVLMTSVLDRVDPAALVPSPVPLAWPPLPAVAFLIGVAALLPAVLAPAAPLTAELAAAPSTTATRAVPATPEVASR